MSPFEQHPVHQAASLHRGLRRRLVSAYQPERLEPRLALAGVVGLVVTGDVLTITGDALANELRIDQVAPNQIRVAPIHDKFSPTGLRDAAGIVGHEPLVFSGIRDVVVRLRGGDDRLFIGPREGLVDIGRGGDPEDFRSPVTVLRSLMVDAGTGADEVSIVGRVVPQAGMTVEFGTGSDQVRTERSERRGPVPAQDAAIHAAGDVVIAKRAGRFEAIIDLPGEGTIGRDLVVRSAAAASSVFVRNGDVIRHLSVVTGQGVDDVTVVFSRVRENLVVVTATGRDTVALGTTLVAGDTRIEAVAGNDTVELRHVNARTRLFALMGAGDDALTLVNVLLSAAPGDVSLVGGRRGRDSLRLEMLRGNGHPSHADFETVTSA